MFFTVSQDKNLIEGKKKKKQIIIISFLLFFLRNKHNFLNVKIIRQWNRLPREAGKSQTPEMLHNNWDRSKMTLKPSILLF